jgi:hypothetical protein
VASRRAALRLPRDHFCRSTIAPHRSRPTTWNEFLPISMPIVKMVAIDLLDMAVLRLTLAPSRHHTPVGQEHGRTIPLLEKNGGSCHLNPDVPALIAEAGFEPHDSDGGRVSPCERPRSRRPSATMPRVVTSPRRPIRPGGRSFRNNTSNFKVTDPLSLIRGP